MRQRKGPQPCNLVNGARDDSIAGDPCYRSLRVRGGALDSSLGSEGKGHRRRVDRLADGTLIGCANYAGCASHSHFCGDAAYGYCAAKSEWVWGVRLILMTDAAGVPVGYELAPANERE